MRIRSVTGCPTSCTETRRVGEAEKTVKTRRVIIIGGGAAGLSAAYTLKKHGINAILLEANDRVGGRLGGDRVDGFCLDEGADFFCSSYDVAFRICEELGLPLIPSKLNHLGWYRNGRWVLTTPIQSVGTLVKNLVAYWKLGMLSPAAMKLIKNAKDQSEYLNFSSECRIVEIDGEENFGDYLKRIGLSDFSRVTMKGFLEMVTMGVVESAGAAYAMTYLSEIAKADQFRVPQHGIGTLAHALSDACGDIIRVSTPVRRVVIRDGAATSVITDDGPIEADAVICAIPATRVSQIIPDLPVGIRHTLGKVTYSSGVRVVIGLDHPPLAPGWHGAVYPEDETPLLLLLDRSINLPAIAPPGKSTLDLLVGEECAKELFPLDDEEIKRQVLGYARRTPPPGSRLPGDDEGLFTRVYRWREAVCMMSPGMFKAVAEMRRQLDRDVKNLFLAGDYMRVPSVNGALASGVGAAHEVAELLASHINGADG